MTESSKDLKQNDYLMKIIYVKNSKFQYKINEDIVTIIIKNDKPIQKIARKLGMKIPLNSQIELDSIGSEVFKNIDGEKNIIEIAEKVKGKFGKKAEPLYDRILLFTKYLEKNSLIKEQNENSNSR